MSGTISTQTRWPAIRTALERLGADFAELAGGVAPDAMATRHWTVADTAAHVTSLVALSLSLVRYEPELPYPELRESFARTSNDTVADFNALTMDVFSERRVPQVARRLAAEIDGILLATADADPTATVGWLGSSQVPIAGVLAHLINELQIHGRDIARATGRPWTIAPDDAAHFMEAFLVGVIRHGYGHLGDNDEPARDRRVAVQFRSAYTTPVAFVLHRGLVTVEEPRSDNDVRLTFDPVTLNLMLFGRVSKARAVLTGGLRVGGPRPWLLPQFLRKMHLPS